MNNFGEYITPEEAYKRQHDTPIKKPLRYFHKIAKTDKLCESCGADKVWKLMDVGLCFSCATGEADASDDYELTEPANHLTGNKAAVK